MVRRKIAKVPADVWDFHKNIAKTFGLKQTTDGFTISKMIMEGELTPKKKVKRKNKHYLEFEFEL